MRLGLRICNGHRDGVWNSVTCKDFEPIVCNVTVAHYRSLHQDNGDTTPTDLHLTIEI